MKTRGRLALALGALVSIGLVAWLYRPAPPEPAPIPAPTVVPALEPEITPAPETPSEPAAAPTERRPAPPPVSAGAPPGCPGDEGDDAGFLRPSIWELLRTETAELRDRLPMLSREASPALREGLGALSGDDPVAAAEALAGAPDRLHDGFDVASAGLVHLGLGALAAGELRTAERLLETGRRARLDEPPRLLLEGLLARRTGEDARARRALIRAFEAWPDEPAIALELARLQADAGELESAGELGARYLRAHPEDRRVEAWAARIAARAAATRGHRRIDRRGLVALWPSDLVDERRVVTLLGAMDETMREVAYLIDRPRRQELTLIIYRDGDAMRRATCAPAWSGGVFDGAIHLDAATTTGPRGEPVARHEATHAQLSRVRGRVPLWLEEGLAQRMEGVPNPSAEATFASMVRHRSVIPFASLEGSLLVIDDAVDARRAYHQSAAMVSYLITRGGRRALRDAIDRVEAGQPEDLLAATLPARAATSEALLAYLAERR